MFLEHDSSSVYVIAGIFVFVALILSAYTTPHNPFNHVLSAAPSSVVQASIYVAFLLDQFTFK